MSEPESKQQRLQAHLSRVLQELQEAAQGRTIRQGLIQRIENHNLIVILLVILLLWQSSWRLSRSFMFTRQSKIRPSFCVGTPVPDALRPDSPVVRDALRPGLVFDWSFPMSTPMRRVSLVAALCLAFFALRSALYALPPSPPGKVAEVKTQDFDGKVVPLAGLLEKFGARLDPDAAPHWLALVTDDGKVYPLVKDDGSRLFYQDKRLLNRPMRLTGKLYPDIRLLQVVDVHSIIKGQLHEVYYWCDICGIRRNEKKPCECCGGPMELKEVPVKK